MIKILDDDKIEMSEECKKQIQGMVEECESKMITRFKEEQKIIIFVSQIQPYCPMNDFLKEVLK